MPQTVAIAGAGLAGRLLAWRLLRAGVSVQLFDSRARDDRGMAAGVAAAMLSPYAEMMVGDAALFSLGEASLAIWPRWIDALQQETGRSVMLRQHGSLVVAHAPDAPGLDHYADLIRFRLPPERRAEVQELDAAELAAREPALAGRFARALWLPREGQLDNGELLAALQAAIQARLPAVGGHWHDGVAVAEVAADGLRTADGRRFAADIVVDCRGAGAGWPGIRGVRGEVLTVRCDDVTLQRPVRLIHPRYLLYVVPRAGQRFVIGATELESQDTGPATLRSVLELGSALYSLHPAFGEARIERIATALRPATDDHQPVWAQREGVWHLNGLYRHGFLVAPAMVQRAESELLAQLQTAATTEEAKR